MRVVYILTNEAMPGLIKIGYTDNTIEKRMKELSRHSGVPLPFTCYYADFISRPGQPIQKFRKDDT